MNSSIKLALITGPTSGIGQVFAYKLASQGYNLVLVARREKRLEHLAEQLAAKYEIKVEYLVADLSCEKDIDKVERYISSLSRIDLLVNNAGFGVAGFFMEIPIEEQLRMVNVHLTSTVRFCKAVIPVMAQRQKGYIINLASFAAFMELPGSVMYATTKAAVIKFSQTLQSEVSGNGIKIQALSPGFTPTAFHSSIQRDVEFVDRVPRFLWTSIDEVVETSLSNIERSRVICVPGAVNSLLFWLNQSPLMSRLMQGVVKKYQKEQPEIVSETKVIKEQESRELSKELSLS